LLPTGQRLVGLSGAAKEAANVHHAIGQLGEPDITRGEKVHLHLRLKWNVAGVGLESKPAPASIDGLDRPTASPHQAFGGLVQWAALSLVEFSTQAAEAMGEQMIQFESAQTQRWRAERLAGTLGFGTIKGGSAGHSTAHGQRRFKQAQVFEDTQAPAAEHFPTDTVAGVAACLPELHRDLAQPETNAQAQTG